MRDVMRIEPVREEIARKAREAVPDLEKTQESPEIWYYTLADANNWTDTQRNRASKILERVSVRHRLFEKNDVIIDPTRDPVVALRTLQVVQNESESKMRREIVHELFRDPVLEIQIIRQLEDVLSRCKRKSVYAQDEPPEPENVPDEESGKTKSLFARAKILRRELPKLAADLKARTETDLAAALTDELADIKEIESQLNASAQNDPELIGAWDMLKTAGIGRISFKNREACIQELIGIFSDLQKEPEWSAEQTKEMEMHAVRLKQDLVQKLRGIASDIRKNLTDEISLYIGEARKSVDPNNEETMIAFEGDFEEEHGVSFDEVLNACDEKFDVCFSADREELERRSRRENGATEEEVTDAKLMLARLKDSFLPKYDSPCFLDRAESLLENLNECGGKTVVEIALNRRKSSDRLVKDYAPIFDKASEKLSQDEELFEQTTEVFGEEMAQALKDNAILSKDGIPVQELYSTFTFAQARFFAEMVNTGAVWRMEPIEHEPEPGANAEEERGKLSAELKETKETLETLSSVSALKWLRIDEAVMDIYKETEEVLEYYIPNAKPDRIETKQKLAYARSTVGKLKRLAGFIAAGPQAKEDNSITVKGKCVISNDPDNPVSILVNPEKFKSGDTKESIVNHEWGHALVHMTTLGTGLITDMAFFEEVLEETENTEGGRKALEEAEEAWGLKENRENILEFWFSFHGIDPALASEEDRKRAEAYYRMKLAEELVMSLTEMMETKESQKETDPSYDPGKDTSRFHEKTRKLWNELGMGAEKANLHPLLPAEQDRLDEANKKFAQMSMAAAADEGEEEGGTAQAERRGQETDIVAKKSVRDQLEEIEWFLHRIDKFMELPGFGKDKENLNTRDSARKGYRHAMNIFKNGVDEDTGRRISNPETDEWFRGVVKKIHDDLGSYVKSLNDLIRETRDLRGEPPRTKTLFEKIWSDRRWISVMDIAKMFKAFGEDLTRMWERRGQRSRNRLGTILTGFIPDNEYPLLCYLGRLKYEVKRRAQDNEQEEVGVWEKSYEHLGPNQLLEKLLDIKSSQDKDRLKAIMNLLAKFGRIDWEDERVWTALSKAGNYSIPHDICKFDRFTRDAWLKKVIDDIWPYDTDLFDKWQNTNHSSFKSKREEYDAFTDVRSNTHEMQHELATQLRIFTEWAIGNKRRGPVPEDFNPYKYEEILYYAMKNGKMSMEEKFFYLIQGVDVGILPLERINVLNKEMISGGFPFMDFFTGKNNSRQEITRLAERLREDNNVHAPNRYKPGQKTKVWLQFVVARDEETRFRAAKILTSRGNEIDHEDIPMLAAMLNMSEINELLQRHGGARQRLTQPALKNAYAGYGTVFRTYVQLAHLSKQPNSNIYFTEEDALTFAKRTLAYIFFDNMVPGEPMRERPNLSWGEIEGESMPSGEKRKVKEFRNPNNEVAASVIKGFFGSGSIQIKGKSVPINEYVAHLRGGKESKTFTKDELREASEKFEEPFLSTLKNNPKKLADILCTFAQRNDLLNEGDLINAEHIELIRRLTNGK